MPYTDDPLHDFHCYDAKKQKELDDLPECDYCNHAIQTHYYQINGDNICPECLDNHFRKDIDFD